MARAPSLKPQLNQIRTWVGEGVTDIWIAHQLDVTPAQIADFRRKQGLLRPDESPAPAKARAPRAAKPKADKPKADKSKAEKPKADKPKPGRRTSATPTTEAPTTGGDDAADAEEAGTAKRRRRGRRGGRGRGRSRAQTIPARIEHTADGVVIRIDAGVLESEAYRAHWSDVAEGAVTVTATGIAIGTAAAAESADDDADDAEA
ncbi:MAG: hypothetical protein ACR2JV_08830 [Gaiellales bacterium]